MNDTTFEVVWKVVETTTYRMTWTAADIADHLRLQVTEVTPAVVTDRFEELLNDQEADDHRDDGPDILERTVTSVQPITAHTEGNPQP